MGFAKAGTVSRKQVKELMLEDLARSGISEVLAKRHKLSPLVAEETYELTQAFACAAYLIPYPGSEDFFRVRFLEEVSNGKKILRYSQPSGTPPSVYFPVFPQVPWDRVLRNSALPLYVTEGEKKAIAGCQSGAPTLGLGGVWAFRAEKWGYTLLPELEGITWTGRTVYLVFDSDILEKKDVQQALSTLSKELSNRGAEVSQLLLPPEHKGLDDYLVAGGKLEDLEVLSVFEHLEALNRDFVYVRSEQKILAVADLEHGQLSRMCTRREASEHYARHPQAEHFKEWNRWTRRNEVGGFIYQPGSVPFPPEYPDHANLWIAPKVEPKKGSIARWRKFMQYLLQSEPGALEYLTWFIAMTVVRPEVKVRASPVLWSEEQGTGKSLCFELLRPLVGEHNFGTPNLSSVASPFNSWLEHKKLLLLNEAYDSADRAISNVLKDIQTADTIEINAKYRAPYHIRNYCHLCVTSNKPTPVYITKSDRRHYVVRTPDYKLELSEYSGLYQWMMHEGGAGAVLWHLENEVDLSRYNPNLEPPLTRAKEEMVEANYTEAERVLVGNTWAKDWAARCDLLDMQQLMAYIHNVAPRITETQVRNSLHRLGARHERIKLQGSWFSAWAVRNFEYWKSATPRAVREHLQQHNPVARSPNAMRRRLRDRNRQ